MSTQGNQAEQERIWDILYARISGMMKRFGKEDGREPGDYWIVDDNWGSKQHKIMFYSLKMLQPDIVRALQRVLIDYPAWEIVVALYIRAMGETWPDMGLIVRAHEIVDGLRRQYFPIEFQSIEYEGSKRGSVV